VCVIGCGNIAGAFDAGKAADALPLTHAGAYTRDGGFVIAACVDPDEAKRSAFRERWRVAESAPDLAALGAGRGAFDVISICSPTRFHGDHLAAALALKPAIVFCEKPVTLSVADTEPNVRAYRDAGVLLAVNHTRRWAPDVVRLQRELAAGEWGAVRSVAGVYNKGVLNNGAHMIDLLHCLVGRLSVVGAGRKVDDFWPDDPSVPALLETERGAAVTLAVGHAADYALFEMQIVTERGVISMEGGGLSWRVRRAGASTDFPGYRTLSAGESVPGEYARAMTAAVANVRRAVELGEPLASTGDSALDAQRVCEQIRMGAHD
jgi:predicted dehydrogenase